MTNAPLPWETASFSREMIAIYVNSIQDGAKDDADLGNRVSYLIDRLLGCYAGPISREELLHVNEITHDVDPRDFIERLRQAPDHLVPIVTMRELVHVRGVDFKVGQVEALSHLVLFYGPAHQA